MRRSGAPIIPWRGTVIGALGAIALLVSGCGGPVPATRGSGAGGTASRSAATAPSAAPQNSWDVTQMPDPCRTITLAEVAAVVVDPVNGGVRLDSWPPLCSFTMPGAPLEYLYLSDDSRSTAKDDFDRQRSDSSTTEAVSGIGDQAYWQAQFTALHVLNGPTHLTVKFAGSRPPADAKTKALALARVALPRAKPSS